MTKDSYIAASPRGKQRAQLAPGRIEARNGDLQHGILAFRGPGIHHKRFGSAGQDLLNRQVPLGRDVAEKIVEPLEPSDACCPEGHHPPSHPVAYLECSRLLRGMNHRVRLEAMPRPDRDRRRH